MLMMKRSDDYASSRNQTEGMVASIDITARVRAAKLAPSRNLPTNVLRGLFKHVLTKSE